MEYHNKLFHNMVTKIAIIVPFRDSCGQNRTAHLKTFVQRMSELFDKQSKRPFEFKIIVVEQSEDGYKFNRGKLLNIGFLTAVAAKCDIFIFHDVDLIPSERLFKQYYMTTPKNEPIHIASVWKRYNNDRNYFGGIVSFTAAQFKKINGFPNNFWGWGGEDNELLLRCKSVNLWTERFHTKEYNNRNKLDAIISAHNGVIDEDIEDLEEYTLEKKLAVLKDNPQWKCQLKRELLDEHDATWKINGLTRIIDTDQFGMSNSAVPNDDAINTIILDGDNVVITTRATYTYARAYNDASTAVEVLDSTATVTRINASGAVNLVNINNDSVGIKFCVDIKLNKDVHDDEAGIKFKRAETILATPQLRNIYSHEENTDTWKAAVASFDNHIPRFLNVKDCVEFVQKHCTTHSNPSEPHLQHSITMLTDWAQIEQYLLPKVANYTHNNRSGVSAGSANIEVEAPNKFFEVDNVAADDDVARKWNALAVGVAKQVRDKTNLAVHNNITPESTRNTLEYMFYHLRSGIFVMIRNNAIVIFAPFVNKHYTNNWGDKFKITSHTKVIDKDAYAKAYYDHKVARQGFVKDNYIPKVSEWWANGNIIDNQHTTADELNSGEKSQWLGDQFLMQLRDMIADTCKNRKVPDCEFFINRRDFPNFKFHETTSDDKDATADVGAKRKRATSEVDASIAAGAETTPVPGFMVEPYGFLFDVDDKNRSTDIRIENARKTYTPICSFYSSADTRFSDILIPPTEDWESATGMVFPPTFQYTMRNGVVTPKHPPRELFTEENFKNQIVAWENKVNVAFFRGTATGGGISIEENQRLRLCALSHEHNRYVGRGGTQLLDAAITGWNARDKKIAGKDMAFIEPTQFHFKGGKQNFVAIYKQASYKYLVYVEGHCASCRYGFMMRLGSVILKVKSTCVADTMWFFPMLQPYIDHVPVKADLSDLMSQIEWCKSHDAECKIIAQNAANLHKKYLAIDGIRDYMQGMMTTLSAHSYNNLPA